MGRLLSLTATRVELHEHQQSARDQHDQRRDDRGLLATDLARRVNGEPRRPPALTPSSQQAKPRGRMLAASAGTPSDMTLEDQPDNRTFPFRFTPAYALAARAFGVDPARARVVVTPSTLVAHYGRWALETDLSNIEAAEVGGPYRFLKTAGPPHLSLSDRGLTFASNGERGVCLRLRVPMRGIEPFGVLRHPNFTVTVADCEGLIAAVLRR